MTYASLPLPRSVDLSEGEIRIEWWIGDERIVLYLTDHEDDPPLVTREAASGGGERVCSDRNGAASYLADSILAALKAKVLTASPAPDSALAEPDGSRLPRS
jgi:hypothetical protein